MSTGASTVAGVGAGPAGLTAAIAAARAGREAG
jgi:thioredoxin reductase